MAENSHSFGAYYKRATSPLAVLRRGYTLVRHTDGSPVTKKEELSPGTALRLQFADGSVPVQVLEEREDE